MSAARAAVSLEVYAALYGEQVAHAATYAPVTGGPVPVTVTISRDLDQVDTGSEARALADAYILSIPRAQLATVMRGDTITLDDGRVFRVQRRSRVDESRWHLLCSP